MARHSAILTLVLVLGLAGCSSKDGAGGSLTSECSGTYLCIVGDDAVDSTLKSAAGSCYLGSVELRPDGSASPIDGKAVRWSGDSERFEVCQGPSCFTCYRNDSSPSAPGASAGGPSASAGGPSASGGAPSARGGAPGAS